MNKPRASAQTRREARAAGSQEPARSQEPGAPRINATRETVESIAVAVILAFLFRAFVAEAFVIPTGSMAPTLMGQHKDVQCPECGYWYQTGASIEIDDEANDQRMLEMGRTPPKAMVVATTCPICRYRLVLDPIDNANERTFSGDRILVSKFVYDFSPPDRWDVIVFKYPGNAKQNFIKRLIGLPGETVLIKRGDIFIKEPGADAFTIARKPDRKLATMLQLVDDNHYISKTLTKIGWPLRWQAWSANGTAAAGLWTTDDSGHSYQTPGLQDQDIWLRYHHIVPGPDEWEEIEEGKQPASFEGLSGELIADFYAYNAFTSVDRRFLSSYDPSLKPEDYAAYPMFGSPSLHPYGTLGLHWVGDLAIDSDVEVQGNQGELLLKLVKGGVDFDCRIDIATGQASLAMDGGEGEFKGDDGTVTRAPKGQTPVQGTGTYHIRYSNVDAELRLWINDARIQFDAPTTYQPRDDLRPVTSDKDPGDLAPLGIGSRGVPLSVTRLRVLRDIYYIATNGSVPHEYDILYRPDQIRDILQNPRSWATTPLFDTRGEFQQELTGDEFFPMGDNSPQSSDARMWNEHYFKQELLIGKALLIYWPHPWYRPIPYMPNFRRMRLIH